MTRRLLLLLLGAGCQEYSLSDPLGGAVEPSTALEGLSIPADEPSAHDAPDGTTPDPFDPPGPALGVPTLPDDLPPLGGDAPAPTDTGAPGLDAPTADPTDDVPAADSGLAVDDPCALAAVREGFLDALQVPGDGRVLFCHRVGDRERWLFLDTSVDACLAHEVNHLDNFPTTGCDS